jgi:Flagellar biosynthesis/type III secretory pathway protein
MKRAAHCLDVGAFPVRAHHFPSLKGLKPGRDMLAEQREHQQGYEQGLSQGMAEGLAQGKLQGIEQGQRLGFDQGYEQGVTAGEQEGIRQGKRLFEEACHPFARMREELDKLARSRLVEQRELLVELVADVARKVIHNELTQHPEQMLLLVQDALNALEGESENLRIYLCPEDRSRLSALGYSECEGWSLEEDSQLSPGDCRIESASSIVETLTEDRLAECLDSVQLALGADPVPDTSHAG